MKPRGGSWTGETARSAGGGNGENTKGDSVVMTSPPGLVFLETIGLSMVGNTSGDSETS